MSKVTKTIIIALVMGILGVLIFLTISSFLNEGKQKTDRIVVGADSVKYPNRLEIHARLQQIDAIKGDVTLRIEFLPYGSIEDSNALGTLNKDIKLLTSSPLKPEIVLKKGQTLNATDISFSLYDGNVTLFPFDHHKCDIGITMMPVIPEINNEPVAQSIAVPADSLVPAPQVSVKDINVFDLGIIPIRLIFSGTTQGYSFTCSPVKLSEQTPEPLSEEEKLGLELMDCAFAGITLQIERSTTSKMISYFIMTMLWLMSLAVLMVTISVVFWNRKLEFGAFTWIGAMIFAFFSFRNAAPGVPAIGAMIDYVSFFWAEVILAICLVSLVLVYLFRKHKS